ncbi:MAG TPA: DUF1289 domain-containing protein [Pseudomonadales bacterium]|jgi:hypothetical protein
MSSDPRHSVRIVTPCIGVCSTALGDSVCRGCKRFNHEVIRWNTYSEPEKQCVDKRLEQLLSQVMQGKFVIFDEGLLRWQIHTQQIRIYVSRDMYCALFELLRAGAGQIRAPKEFGFDVRSEYAGQSLFALREQVDREFYVLSEVYYERHVGPLVQVSS